MYDTRSSQGIPPVCQTPLSGDIGALVLDQMAGGLCRRTVRIAHPCHNNVGSRRLLATIWPAYEPPNLRESSSAGPCETDGLNRYSA